MNIILITTVAGACLMVASAVPQFEITRQTIDGGGVVRSTGGAFELSGTIGQPDAGRMAGGSFELTGGFWFELQSGDCDENGGVGVADLAAFRECMTGPAVDAGSTCLCFDQDQSDTVDLADFASLQLMLTP